MKKKNFNVIWKIFLIFPLLGGILSGCSTAQRELRQKLRDNFGNGNYQEALGLLEKSELKEDKSRLLYYLEKGLIHHTAGEYYLSNLNLEKAKELAQQLFTISLSKKVLTGVTNDTSDLYYGANFERSLIHFYLGLNHFLLWQKGEIESYSAKLAGIEGKGDEIIPAKILEAKERQRELVAARAELLAWDSVLNANKEEKRGKSVFKDDMLAKVYGAFIHEAFGTNSDDQTALQLYKDAKELLFKNYNAYKTFNNKSVNFKRDFSKFPEMDPEKVRSDYVEATAYQKDLVEFLDYKILSLTQRIRPGEMKQVLAQLRPSKEILEKVEREKGKADNVGVLLQLGMIPEKVPDKYNIGLEGAMNQVEDSKTRQAIASVGVPILAAFAAETLGLVPDANHWSPPGAMLGLITAQVAVSTVGISFELPKVESSPTQEKALLEIFDKEGKLIKETPLVLLNPLGDIAEEANAEEAISNYTRTGIRVAMKHVTAILAAFATYKMLAGEGNGMSAFLAKNAALLEYVAASKVIEASEKADVRYWSTLPKDLRMVHFYLPQGEYSLRMKIQAPNGQGGDVIRSFDLGTLKVADEKMKTIFNLRVKNLKT